MEDAKINQVFEFTYAASKGVSERKILVMQKDAKYVAGIDLALLDANEQEHLILAVERFRHLVDAVMEKAYRRFKWNQIVHDRPEETDTDAPDIPQPSANDETSVEIPIQSKEPESGMDKQSFTALTTQTVTYWTCPRCHSRCFESRQTATAMHGAVLKPPRNVSEAGRCVCGFVFPYHRSEYRKQTTLPTRL